MSKGNSENKKDKEQVLKTAYALNMLTVSVSQIVDYNDIFILEQEYDAIINNLNLENMPKDEELLTVFEQLLDTITFFRIQEKEKQFINEEYQRKMKNAIWSSAPNFIALITGKGLPVKQLFFQMAFMAGITYMNYRKNKAEYLLDRDRKLWELQRTAIEQFNSIRRKLFDAAWRLSDEEEWNENWRLTEKQIHQYNMILIDSNAARRYERLNYIKEKFEAYPPFWYFYGSSALEVANENERINENKRSELIKEAKSAFDKFNKLKDNDILRTDPISSQCQLEYINLLYDKKNSADLSASERKEIKERLDKAVEMSGDAFDTLQICAIEYLAIQEKASAKRLFKHLITEDYNKDINVQILSKLYAEDALSCHDNDDRIVLKGEYDILYSLCGLGYREYMYPYPDNGKVDNEGFVYQLQTRSIRNYYLVIRSYIEKYGIEFNRLIPCLQRRVRDENLYYSTNPEAGAVRLALAESKSKGLFWNHFVNELASVSFAEEHLNIMNNLYAAIDGLRFLTDDQRDELFNSIAEVFSDESIRYNYETIQTSLDTGKFSFEDYKLLDKMSYNNFVQAYVEKLSLFGEEYIKKTGEDSLSKSDELDISKFSSFDNDLYEFCVQQGISTDILKPDITEDYLEREAIYTDSSFRRFSPKMLGSTIEQYSHKTKAKGEMIDTISKAKEGLIKQNDGQKNPIRLLIKGDPDFDEYVCRYQRDARKRSNIVAVLDDTTPIGGKDIIFYTSHFRYGLLSYKYQDYEIDEKKGVKLNAFTWYNLVGVNSGKLQELISKLKSNAESIEGIQKAIDADNKEEKKSAKNASISAKETKQIKENISSIIKESFGSDSLFDSNKGKFPFEKNFRTWSIQFYADKFILNEIGAGGKVTSKRPVKYADLKNVEKPTEDEICIILQNDERLPFVVKYRNESASASLNKIVNVLQECIKCSGVTPLDMVKEEDTEKS